MKTMTAALLLGATLATTRLSAAEVTYVFDTVTAVDMNWDHPTITGLAKDTLAVQTLQITDRTSIDYRYAISRCVPLFLTALEKPGRYFLHVTVEPTELFQLRSCKLEVKS